MRIFPVVVMSLIFVNGASAKEPSDEIPVRHAIQAFYDAFNSHGFERASEFTTADWNHINPGGGPTRGRKAVLKELREVKRASHWWVMQDQNTAIGG